MAIRISRSRLAARAEKLVSQLLAAGFCSDVPSLPKDFDQWDPLLFAQTVLGATTKTSEKITMFAWTSPDIYGPVLEKLAQARPHLLGSDSDDLFSALYVSLDYGVLGGETFVPSIMPNGSILIRNHHRVIGFETRPSLVVRATPRELRHELLACQKKLATDLEPYEALSVIHRCGNGEIGWVCELPDTLSDVGQSLVLIGHRLNAAPSKLLSALPLMEICEQSRIGIVALRTFGSFATVHRSIRIDDDFDTLLEEFAQAYLDGVGEPRGLTADQYESSLKKTFHARAMEIYESSGMPTLAADPCRHYIEKLVGAEDPQGWGHIKLKQCLQLLPIFARSPDLPATPGFSLTPYHYATKAGLWAVLELDCSRSAKFGRLPQNVQNALNVAASTGKKIKGARIIVTATHASQLDSLLTESPSTRSASAKKILAAVDGWVRSLKHSILEQKTKLPLQVCVLRRAGEHPSIEDTLEWSKNCSKASGSLAVTLTVPSLGLRQTYRKGKAEEGNSQAFTTSRP
jgi:hypothetical protein